MEGDVARDGEANERGNSSRTPAVARSFYLRVLKVNYPNMPIRTAREMKTLCFALDCLAKSGAAEAADILGQRLMACEKALADGGSWQKAQYCELVPQDASTLMNPDMEHMAAKEVELQQKISRGSGGKGWGENSGGKGQGGPPWHEYSGKDRDKDKGKHKGDKGDKNSKSGKDGKGSKWK